MPPAEAPQLRFLSDAAQILGMNSPSTSAHLLSTHTRILHEESKSLNARLQKHHCGACGSLRQSKGSQTTEIKPESKAASKLDATGGATVHKCPRCRRRTVIPRKRTLPKPSSRAPTATATPTPSTSNSTSTPVNASSQQASSLITAEAQPTTAADNANSKKRAKVRKQGGLQALLASKQRAQPSLDLLDFLQ